MVECHKIANLKGLNFPTHMISCLTELPLYRLIIYIDGCILWCAHFLFILMLYLFIHFWHWYTRIPNKVIYASNHKQATTTTKNLHIIFSSGLFHLNIPGRGWECHLFQTHPPPIEEKKNFHPPPPVYFWKYPTTTRKKTRKIISFIETPRASH